MIHATAAVPDAAVTANPQLRGRTPLQIYDAVVTALTQDGFAVVLNNHTNTSRWCCGIDGNERWNSSQSTGQWADDWVFMARRYASDPRVVGADLYNEVRRDILDDPDWGAGDEHDWFAAAQLAADRILTEANPDLLIVIEGINWTGLPVDGLRTADPPSLRHARSPTRSWPPTSWCTPPTSTDTRGPTTAVRPASARPTTPVPDLTREELYRELTDEAFFITEGEPLHRSRVDQRVRHRSR